MHDPALTMTIAPSGLAACSSGRHNGRRRPAIAPLHLTTARPPRTEQAVRIDLAAAYRLTALAGWDDTVYTHLSASVPGEPAVYLINQFGLGFDEVTASNLVKIDHRGNIIEDITGYGVNQAGFVIHGCVHEARPEAQCVLHTHTRAGIAVSATTEGLLPLSQHSARLVGEVTYHAYEGIALDRDERERLAQNLGPVSRCMVLRNHGLLTLGRSVREAFNLMYNLEQSCRTQHHGRRGVAGQAVDGPGDQSYLHFVHATP